MFLLIPFLLGAGSTGYWWWSSNKEEEEPTFEKDLFAILKPILIILLGLLLIRWLYAKGTTAEKATTNAST